MAVTTNDNTMRAPADDRLLWAGVLIGPFAWALDEGLSYSLSQHSCSTGHAYVLHAISVCCFVLALIGAWIARTQIRRTGVGEEDGGSRRDRSWWMARLGIAFCLGFSLVIIAMEIPKIVLNPCD